MSARPTPPLSPEGIKQIEEQLRNPPADTPERRATFERARAAEFLVRQTIGQALPKKR